MDATLIPQQGYWIDPRPSGCYVSGCVRKRRMEIDDNATSGPIKKVGEARPQPRVIKRFKHRLKKAGIPHTSMAHTHHMLAQRGNARERKGDVNGGQRYDIGQAVVRRQTSGAAVRAAECPWDRRLESTETATDLDYGCGDGELKRRAMEAPV